MKKMNNYELNAIRVPTKKADESRQGNSGRGGPRSSIRPSSVGPMATTTNPNGGQRAVRRPSSSDNSLDVAASLFSSMQDLEASGRNLSSLRLGATRGLSPADLLDAHLGGAMGVNAQAAAAAGLLGGGRNNYSQQLQQQREAMSRDMFNAALAGNLSRMDNNTSHSLNQLLGSGVSGAPSSMELAAIRNMPLLQQQQQSRNNQSLFDGLKGGYNPISSTSPGSRRPSHASSILDDFTHEELFREVSRRRRSNELLAGMQGGLGGVGGGSRLLSDDLLAGLQQQGGVGTGQGNTSYVRRESNNSIGGSSMFDGMNMAALSRNNSHDDLVEMYKMSLLRNSNTSGGSGDDLLEMYKISLRENLNNERVGEGNSGVTLASLMGSSTNNGIDLQSRGGEGIGMGRFLSNMYDDPMRQQRMDEILKMTWERQENNVSAQTAQAPLARTDSNGSGKEESSETGDVVVIVPTAKPASKLIGQRGAVSGGKKKKAKPQAETEQEGTTTENHPCDNSDSSNSTVVTATDEPQSLNPKDKKEKARKKRSSSTASFDALLSAFGDELNELDREKNGESESKAGDDDKSTSANSVDFFNDLIEKTAATVAAKKKEEEDKKKKEDSVTKKKMRGRKRSNSSDSLTSLTLKERIERRMSENSTDGSVLSLASAEDQLQQRPPSRSSINPQPGNAALSHLDTLLDMNTVIKNERNKQSASSIMASLEAMRREEVMIRERALREQEFILRENALRHMAGVGLPRPHHMMPPGGFSNLEMGSLAGLFGGRVHGLGEGPNLPSSLGNNINAAAQAMLDRLQGLPAARHHPSLNHMLGTPKPIFRNDKEPLVIPGKTSPTDVHRPPPSKCPKEVLKVFHDEYGEPAEKASKRMLEAIDKSEKSLMKIHAWDKSQGLRKCHSRTVVKTRQSRGKLKAFLTGVAAPKEPQKKKKKISRCKQWHEAGADSSTFE